MAVSVDKATQLVGLLTLVFTAPFILYIIYEQQCYFNVYKHAKTSIHTKSGKTFQNLYIKDIDKIGEWICINLPKENEIKIHIDNIDYFEYYD